MRKLLILFIALGLSPVLQAEACDGESSDCVAIGEWQFSLGVGLGGRTNPLIDGDDIPIVLLPEVSYYGERFFFDTTSLGFTLYEDRTHRLNLVATVGLDSMYFSDISVGNFVIEGTGGGFNAGGLVASDAGGDGGVEVAAAPPKDETTTPNTHDTDGPNEFFHKPFSEQVTPEPQTEVGINDIAKRRMAGLAGIEYSMLLNQTQLSLQALQDFTSVHDGQEIRVGIDQLLYAGKNQFAVAGGFVWQSAEVVDYYYGLDARDVADNIELYYQAGDAITPFVRADWLRPIGKHWTLQFTVHNKWLGSDIRHSPLVEESTSTTVFVGGVYHF